MKVLVVGGAGFLGSVVVQRLCQAGHDVTVCDNLSTGNVSSAAVRVGGPGAGHVRRAGNPAPGGPAE